MVLAANFFLFALVCFLLYRLTILKERYEWIPAQDLPYLRGVSLMLDSIEGYEGSHAVQMIREASKLGEVLQLSGETISSLKVAAALHDSGEVFFSKDLLKRNRKLEPEEWFLIKTHPVLAEHCLKKVLPPSDEVPSIIRWHHERWDGTGYPDRLAGKEIPVSARILAVVDAVSAMSHDRPYRKALLPSQIRDELKRLAGFQFDPEIVRIMLESEGSAGESVKES